MSAEALGCTKARRAGNRVFLAAAGWYLIRRINYLGAAFFRRRAANCLSLRLFFKNDLSLKMYREVKRLDLPAIDQEIAAFWEKEQVFNKSVNQRPVDRSLYSTKGRRRLTASPVSTT